MSFRLQRSIKIAKGVRLNVSKSGLGVSVGPRGAKISAGPRGVYASAGIPGTGLSTRQKISGSSISNSQKTQNAGDSSRNIKVEITMDDETGKETVHLYEGTTKLNDESLLRKIKRDPLFKEQLVAGRKRILNEISERTNVLIEVHKHSEKLTEWNKISEKVKNSKPTTYAKQIFKKEEPRKEDIELNLQIDANKNVKGLFGKKNRRQAYIDERLENEFKLALEKWSTEKKDFENNEIETEKSENEKYLKEYNDWIQEMSRLLNPDTEYIEDRLNDLFSEIQLPADFSVSFEVKNNGSDLLLDIDLPEIEDFPTKKVQELASGKLSIKNKTQKELKEEYFTCISGIGIYIASVAFTSSPTIRSITVSGYTQRVNKANGNTEDEYVYSVKFNKENFGNLNFDKIDPKLTIQSFEHRISATKTYDLKKIEPFNI